VKIKEENKKTENKSEREKLVSNYKGRKKEKPLRVQVIKRKGKN